MKKKKLKIKYKQVTDLPEKEIELNIERAYDVLFTATMENIKNDTNSRI